MSSQPTEPSRLPSLTGMRFAAAFLVFLCHSFVLGFYHPETEAALRPYAFAIGWLGVEFFFVLSGFVLTWSVREGQPARRFWRRRLAKVYPNHVVTWFAALALALWAGQTLDLFKLLPSLFLVHTWYPRLDVILSLNVVTWSLACDLLFYLAFPLLYALVRRVPARRLWWVAAGIVAVVMLLPAVAQAWLPGEPKLPGQDMTLTQNWLLVSFPPVRALDFTLGIVMARIVRTGGWIRFGPVPALALLVLGFAVQVSQFPGVYSLTAPIVAPLALLIPAVATADVRGGFSPFRGRVLQWLGAVSYASYLVHFLVLVHGHTVLGAGRTWDAVPATALLAALFAVTTLLAWALYRLVEEPGMRRWGRPKPLPTPHAAPLPTPHAVPPPTAAADGRTPAAPTAPAASD
ncbi:acyltransferase family protein [Streptomyces sp. NPDC090093]|uniref:acyltransferase family protein n=1 Tax=Streptomyces sp. NPDC090093 TaxID=3365945 RepID=UPI003814CF6D